MTDGGFHTTHCLCGGAGDEAHRRILWGVKHVSDILFDTYSQADGYCPLGYEIVEIPRDNDTSKWGLRKCTPHRSDRCSDCVAGRYCTEVR